MWSTKVAIACALVWLGLNVLAYWSVPRDPIEYDDLSALAQMGITLMRALANMLLFSTFVSIGVTVFKRLKRGSGDRSANEADQEPVEQTDADVVTDNEEEDQSGVVRESTAPVELSDQHVEALNLLLAHINTTKVSESEKKQAQKIVNTITSQRKGVTAANGRLRHDIKDFLDIAESTDPDLESLSFAIGMLRSVI